MSLGIKVIIYTTKNCPRCEALKRELNKVTKPIEKDLLDSDVMLDLHMRNAPVMNAPSIEIAGMVFEYRGGA